MENRGGIDAGRITKVSKLVSALDGLDPVDRAAMRDVFALAALGFARQGDVQGFGGTACSCAWADGSLVVDPGCPVHDDGVGAEWLSAW